MIKSVSFFSEIKSSYSYDEYRALVFKCAQDQTTTGKEQLPERIEATKINAQRMKRIDKQTKIVPAVEEILKRLEVGWIWLILTEAWCGDSAQNIPVISKIAESSPNIELKLILRDENPDIMNAYLTDGSRSIPKLVCINSKTKEEVGVWGPRPLAIKQMVKDYKQEHPTASHDEFVKNLHLWYAHDKGESIQAEFVQMIPQWISKSQRDL